MLLKPLLIDQKYWSEMQSHVESIFPEEACGLIAGYDSKVFSVMPVKNVLQSQDRFRMDAQEQLNCFLKIEKENWDLLGIFHSHPHGPAFPSKIDIEEAYYPDSAYLIWAPVERNWICHAFQIKNSQVTQRNILIK
jgi:proteasome lid subunit RPN8/RPN11